MLTVDHPYAELAARFRFLILGLCAVVASYIAKDFTAGPLVGAIYMRLRRCSLRFDSIVARIGLGARPVTPRGSGPRRPRARALDWLPVRRGWLTELLGHEAAAYGGYEGRLGYLVRDPAMAALLAASPQIGRVLRPLWRMLSTDKLPPALRPPPRTPAQHASGGNSPAARAPDPPALNAPSVSPRAAGQPFSDGRVRSDPPIPT